MSVVERTRELSKSLYVLPFGSRLGAQTIAAYKSVEIKDLTPEFCSEILEAIPTEERIVFEMKIRWCIEQYGGDFKSRLILWVKVCLVDALRRNSGKKWTPQDILQEIQKTRTAEGTLLPWPTKRKPLKSNR